MSKKFITSREMDFIDDIVKEFIQDVVQQEVNYYALSLPHTRVNVYRESVEKVWASPIKINALVLYENTGVRTTSMGLDSQYRVDVHFHDAELVERNVDPREGDMIEFGSMYYEIASVTRPQLVYGQIHRKIAVKCSCVPSREGQFQAGSDSELLVDNSHPVSGSEC